MERIGGGGDGRVGLCGDQGTREGFRERVSGVPSECGDRDEYEPVSGE